MSPLFRICSKTLSVMSKRKIITSAYSAIQPYKSLHRDRAWERLRQCVDAIADGTGGLVTLGGGVYKVSADGLTHWKEYSLEIVKDDIKVEGLLTAHAGGTLADPFSCYDITMMLW